MKAAVVYFSLEGNTQFAARCLAEKTGADLFELKPVHPYPTGAFSKYLHGGKSSTLEEKPALESIAFDADRYDVVFVGTPLWAWKIAPPLRTFLTLYPLGKCRAAAFICSGGGNPQRAFDTIRTLTGQSALPTVALVNALRNKETAQQQLDAFCKAVMA